MELKHKVIKELEGTYYYIPFDVPENVIKLTVSYDYFRRHGIKREGIISSLTGVMNRLNGLYTSLAFFFVSTKFGFVNGDDPGTNPALASRVLLCIFPAAAMVIASVIAFFLHFDEKDEKVSDN